MATDAIPLHGCTATPLASYLKALGVLRLVSSPSNHAHGVAADAHARGWWEHGHFHLATSLGSDGLIRFLLDEYAPSAIIAPWNGGSGFYPKDNKEGIGPLSGAVAARFRAIGSAITVAAGEIRRRGWDARPEADAKAELIATLRGRLADSALRWLDATVALSGGRLSFPQLLGTGGNDGRLDFTNNFMRRLVAARDGLFDAATGAPAPQSERLLRAALEADSAQELRSYSAGPVLARCRGRSERDRGVRRTRTRQSVGVRAGAGRGRPVRGGCDPPPSGRPRNGSELSVHRAAHRRRLGWRRRGRPNQRPCRVLGAAVGPSCRL